MWLSAEIDFFLNTDACGWSQNAAVSQQAQFCSKMSYSPYATGTAWREIIVVSKYVMKQQLAKVEDNDSDSWQKVVGKWCWVS